VIKFIFIFLMTVTQAFAQMNFCTSELETYPVQAGGREKPLFVLASETIRFMTGSDKIDNLSATEAFCKLSLMAFGMPLSLPVHIKVEHVDAKKLLGLSEDKSSIPATELEAKADLITEEVAQIKENNSYKKELNKVLQRLNAYRAIINARAWTVPLKTDNKIEFVSIAEFLTQSRVESVKDKASNPVKYLFEQSKADYLQIKGDKYLLEYKYYKWNLFVWALFSSIISIALFVLLKNKTPGTIFCILTIGLEIVAMTLRIMISGRAPITNMYETVMFSGFGALIISCGIYFVRKDIVFVIAGLAYNVLGLMMMKFANGMLDEGIFSPSFPVFKETISGFSTHVSNHYSFLCGPGLVLDACKCSSFKKPFR